MKSKEGCFLEVKGFIKSTVNDFEDKYFEVLKEKLVGEYISFSFIEDNDITIAIFSEKLFDYFEKLQLKTGDNFDKFILKYVSDLDGMVSRRILKEPQAKKNESEEPTPRSRKYYNYALDIKNSRKLTIKQILDYSRIMMCLYMSIINKKYNEIDDFEYSSECLNLDKIIASMKSEKPYGVKNFGRKTLFDIKELYCSDTSTFIITMIMFYYIKNNEVLGE